MGSNPDSENDLECRDATHGDAKSGKSENNEGHFWTFPFERGEATHKEFIPISSHSHRKKPLSELL